MKSYRVAALAAVLAMTGTAVAGETPAPPGAMVYFVNLKDGATVSSPVKIIFGLTGMGVAPAGVAKKNTGHHHLLIDRPELGKRRLLRDSPGQPQSRGGLGPVRRVRQISGRDLRRAVRIAIAQVNVSA